jgi:competence protein ComEC
MRAFLGGVVIGIIAVDLGGIGMLGAVAGAVLFGASVVQVVVSRSRQSFLKLFIGVAGFVCAVIATSEQIVLYETTARSLQGCIGHACTYQGQVIGAATQKKNGDEYEVAITRVEEIPIATRVLVTQPPFSDLHDGDNVTLMGSLHVPAAFTATNGKVVDYPRLLRARGIHGTIRLAHVEHTGNERSLGVKARAFTSGAEQTIDAAIREPAAGLASGVLFGEKHALTEQLEMVFRRTGLSHITVLSGSNIAILIAFLFAVFRFTPLSMRVVITICVIGMFVLATGVTAPSLRAALMGGLVLVARSVGKGTTGLDVLVATSVALLLYTPLSLIGDVSLQLSLLATYGVVYVAPLLEHAWERSIPQPLLPLLASTAAALIMVSPWVIYAFGSISIVAPIANMLVVPIVPVVMFWVACTVVSMPVLPPLSFVCGAVAEVLLRFIIVSAEYLSAFPAASLTMPPISIWSVCAMYALIGIYVVRLRKQALSHA